MNTQLHNQAYKTKLALLSNIYEGHSVNQEFQTSAEKLANSVKIHGTTVAKFLNFLKEEGIISVRRTYGKGRGPKSLYTILKPFPEAQKIVIQDHNNSLMEGSLKARIMGILSHGPNGLTFKTTRELGDRLNLTNGGSTDFHNLTHVLHVLKREGKITFDTDSTKDKVPYNIKLKAFRETNKPVDIMEEASESTPEISEAPRAVLDAPSAFPVIEHLMARRERLETAAQLATEAKEEDIAIMLMERAEKPLSPLEEEAINLYIAYMACKDK